MLKNVADNGIPNRHLWLLNLINARLICFVQDTNCSADYSASYGQNQEKEKNSDCWNEYLHSEKLFRPKRGSLNFNQFKIMGYSRNISKTLSVPLQHSPSKISKMVGFLLLKCSLQLMGIGRPQLETDANEIFPWKPFWRELSGRIETGNSCHS